MKETDVKQLHALVLGDPECGQDFLQWMDEHALVEHAETFDDALKTVRARPFDIVISRAADLTRFEGVPFAGEAAAVFDGVNQGVCIVRETGELEWANPKMLSFEDEVRDKVCRCCRDAFAVTQAESTEGVKQLRSRRFSIATDRDEHFDVNATLVVGRDDRVSRMVAVVWNTTFTQRLQGKIDAIDRAGRELLSLDIEQFSRLDAQERLSLLEQKIRRCTNDLLHFDNFEIRVLNKPDNRLELALAAGMPSEIQDVDLYASTDGNGICGYVAARGRSYICPDVSADSRYRPGIQNARSSLTVPLSLHDKVVGVANFESTKLAAFNEDDRQFAEIFGRYVVLALHLLELLVTERHMVTGRLGQDVMAEITAPLNDILTDVETLVEDYIGHDDLRHRLRKISENAANIRASVKQVTSSTPGVLGARFVAAKRKDPILEGKRILIADDEPMIRDTVRDVLVGYGCSVCAVPDGEAAIDLIAQHGFDLVLSDIEMPRRSGYEVFAAAKDANPNTPVILTTGFGYDPNHSIVRARREGLASVLFKPFKVDQLLGEIRMALTSADK